jgi:hypothetical protein
VIRILMADDQHLVRGALAALLNLEPDLEVVAEVARGDEVVAAASAGSTTRSPRPTRRTASASCSAGASFTTKPSAPASMARRR